MQQWYKCPQCGKDIQYATNPCPHCKWTLDWRQQPPSVYMPPPGAPQQQASQAHIEAPQQQVVQPATNLQSTKKTTNPLVIILAVIGGIVLLFGTCAICVSNSAKSPLPSVLSGTEFQIKVSGTAGLPFSGSYMVMQPGGQNTSKSVDGVVPVTYSVTGNMVSVAFQKKIEIGTLKVEILRGGTVVNSSDTTAAYGLVSVATY